MPYVDKIINWNEFITFNKGGLVVAEYSKIRIALQNAFKSIYGEDVDLSTGTADGVYLDMYGLIINNILQSFKFFYNNLNINNASGKYLDNLCALSNVTRKPASYSTAKLLCTLDESNPTDYTVKATGTGSSGLAFLDQNGTIWYFEPDEDYTFVRGVQQEIVVRCEDLGPIAAVPGFINRLVTNEVTMSISQNEYAQVGAYEETDSELRARRNQSLGASGDTVLESLAGALLAYEAIEDVEIYNGDTAKTAKDGTAIAAHRVYIILRRNLNIELDDKVIGTLIYEKMTPGIPTIPSTDENMGEAPYGNHSFQYVQKILGQPIDTGINQMVYWKVAKPIAPEIKITITPNSYFASNNNSTANLIGDNIIAMMNDIHLGDDVTIKDLENEVYYSDPFFRGRATFDIKSITINSLADKFINKDTYFNYTNYTVSNTYDPVETTKLNEVVITIKGNE